MPIGKSTAVQCAAMGHRTGVTAPDEELSRAHLAASVQVVDVLAFAATHAARVYSRCAALALCVQAGVRVPDLFTADTAKVEHA